MTRYLSSSSQIRANYAILIKRSGVECVWATSYTQETENNLTKNSVLSKQIC